MDVVDVVGRRIVVDVRWVADESIDFAVVGAVDFDFDELLHPANTKTIESDTSASARVVDVTWARPRTRIDPPGPGNAPREPGDATPACRRISGPNGLQ